MTKVEGSAGTQRRLTRRSIIESAIALVDHEGLAQLSMRRLGTALGVEGMAIYHHVNGREDLLEGMVALLIDGIDVSPHEPLGPTDGWQAYVQKVAHAVREVATAHPNLFPLIATRPPAAPWLRPPLRSLALVEDFLVGLTQRGVSDDEAVYVYKAFAGFLLGHLLLEVAQAGAETSPPDEPLNEGDASVPTGDEGVSVADYPTVQRLSEGLKDHDADAEFERALESLLDRLDHQLSQ